MTADQFKIGDVITSIAGAKSYWVVVHRTEFTTQFQCVWHAEETMIGQFATVTSGVSLQDWAPVNAS